MPRLRRIFETYCPELRTVLAVTFLLTAYPLACATDQHVALQAQANVAAIEQAEAPVVRAPETIRAHWTKSGEAAPFDGVLLSEAAYTGLREKITRLQAELAACKTAPQEHP